MGSHKRKLIEDKRNGERHSGKPANPGARGEHIGPSYAPVYGGFNILSGALSARPKPIHPLLAKGVRQATFRFLGLDYDENGKGYWTRGLSRLRAAGLVVPIPPNRIPLIVLDNAE